MKFTEMIGLLNLGIKENWNSKLQIFQVRLRGVEVMESGCLRGAWGGGKTLEDAWREYVDEIKGKRIAIDAFRNRRAYNIPETLYYDAGEVPA